MSTSAEDELQRINAIPESISVLKVFFPHNTGESIAPSHPPAAFRGDLDDIFDSFFPRDDEEFMRKRGSSESEKYLKRPAYCSSSHGHGKSSSDESTIFVSETKVPPFTKQTSTESNKTSREASSTSKHTPLELSTKLAQFQIITSFRHTVIRYYFPSLTIRKAVQ